MKYRISDFTYKSTSDEIKNSLWEGAFILICKNSELSSSLLYSVYDFKYKEPKLLAKFADLILAKSFVTKCIYNEAI